jgi:hypothetical protein
MRSATLTLALAGLILANTAPALAQGDSTNLTTATNVTVVPNQATVVPVRYGYGPGWYGYYGPRYYSYRPYYYYGATPYYDVVPAVPYTGYYGTGYYGGYYYPNRYGYRYWGPGRYRY